MSNQLIRNDFNLFFNNIKDLVINSRNKVYQVVNIEMLNLYWNIGKSIIEIQQGEERANYGDTILDKLSQKLTSEFGKGFSYVGNQVRLTLEEEHFYPDLVFYNRLLKCFVIIDLKVGKVSHQDIGQMQMYVNYYDRKIKQNDENKTIGILLSTNKNETVVKYTLPEDNKTIFSSE